ncbi:MAG TPA: lipoprotein-releasing ABC transporter permease subunit [Steroidobacteraceae bacterium]|nr:lipoprotein-releasing ABC transporter permease subunit [Steroidobacteraceae bacterium]
MFYPLPAFVGLRYVRARTHKFFVSFITWVSLTGVCVGVAALIVILSVMNGFEDELRERLLALSSDARVIATSAARQPTAAEWNAARRAVASVPGVAGVAPYLEAQALAVSSPDMVPVTLRGIDPRVEASVTQVARAVKEGSLAQLTPGSDRAIAGAEVAQELALTPGDTMTLLIPTLLPDGTPAPKLRRLTVTGVFEAGLEENDDTLVFANIDDVRALGAAASGEGLHVRLDDPLAAPRLAARIRAVLPAGFQVIDWTADNADYFRAIRIEKTMMSLILLLIVAVAAFNIVAMLVMVVNDKRTDIAILRTFGASPARVMGVFITQGLVIGWVGVALGIALGVVLALNVQTIVPALESTFHFHILNPDVYYNTEIPSDLHWSNVAAIALAALVLTTVATIYPALRAAGTPPADALRYE